MQSDGNEPSNAEGFLWVFQEGYERVSEIRIGPVGLKLLKGMYHSIASLAETGIDLIIDDVVIDTRVLQEAVNALHTFNVLFVGICCPIEVAKQREQERADRYQGLVEAHFDIVHSHGVYDLEVDTSILTPPECAKIIKTRLQSGPTPNAIRQLKNQLESR